MVHLDYERQSCARCRAYAQYDTLDDTPVIQGSYVPIGQIKVVEAYQFQGSINHEVSERYGRKKKGSRGH